MKTENILEGKSEVEVLRQGFKDLKLHMEIMHQSENVLMLSSTYRIILKTLEEAEQAKGRTFSIEEVELILTAATYNPDRTFESLSKEAKLAYFSFINIAKQQKKKELLDGK